MDKWSICDFWRSYYLALAIENGHDPEAAVANHRDWCVNQELEETNESVAASNQ